MNDDATLPLVTFAVLGYNQERFIGEAIEAAFSQTYEPLEIILSDDGSSDRTYDVMEDMASRYAGPHRVRIRRSQGNVGTLSHLIQVGHEAEGEILVVAAGDDISLPERTTILESAFRDENVWGASSRDAVVTKEGLTGRSGGSRTLPANSPKNPMKSSPLVIIHGATSAYRKALFNELKVPDRKILVEDYILSIIIHAIGKSVASVDERLVLYLWHNNNISQRGSEDVSATKSRHKLVLQSLIYLRDLAEGSGSFGESLRSGLLDLRKLSEEIEYTEYLSQWDTLPFSKKLRFMSVSKRRGALQTAVPRLFGPKVFNLVTAMKRRVRS